MDTTPRGELLLITGPPAVGKMTVGRAVCDRSDFRLFHNHHTIEPLLAVFGHGTPPFETLNAEFRHRVIQEAAAAHLWLVLTFVRYVDDPADAAEVRRLVAPYLDAGLPVRAVELDADLATRLVRNTGASRIAAKPSKADLAWSDAPCPRAPDHHPARPVEPRRRRARRPPAPAPGHHAPGGRAGGGGDRGLAGVPWSYRRLSRHQR